MKPLLVLVLALALASCISKQDEVANAESACIAKGVMPSDPGFNNPLNTQDPGNGGEMTETFTFDIDWGDGTAPSLGFATVDSAGSVGAPTLASFNGMHTYADNGVYTVTVTVLCVCCTIAMMMIRLLG